MIGESTTPRKPEMSPVVRQWINTIVPQIVGHVMDHLPAAVRETLTSLEAIESGIQCLTRCIGQQVTETWMTEQPRVPLGTCRECGTPLRAVGNRERLILGVFGDYRVDRVYGVCPQGHGSDVPQDRVWGLGPGQTSPLLSRMLTRLAIEMPFDQVPEVVEEMLGRTIDGERVRRTAEAIGTWAEAQEQQTMDALMTGDVAVPVVPGPSTLVIALDGAMVHTDQDGEVGWHEGKVGVCARFEPVVDPRLRDANDRPTRFGLVPSDFCIGFESREAFLPRLYTHAVGMGLEDPSCTHVVLIGDGAHWIWEHGAEHLHPPGKMVTEILDFYHASEHVWTVAHAVWPANPTAAQSWADTTLHALRHEGAAGLAGAWGELPPLTPIASAAVAKEQAYFTYHAGRIEYPRYAAWGLPIGSGMVESACKTVLKERESGSGMRWLETGAQAIATLRAWHRSQRWDNLWAQHPCAQLVPVQRRIAA